MACGGCSTCKQEGGREGGRERQIDKTVEYYMGKMYAREPPHRPYNRHTHICLMHCVSPPLYPLPPSCTCSIHSSSLH